MSEIGVEYDREKGALKVTADLEANLVILPLLEDSANLVRDLSKAGLGILEGLIALQQEVLEAQKKE